MLAVIATGGKQYLVKTGEEIKIEKLIAKEGETVKFAEILLTANDDGSNVKLGKPFVDGVEISATVVKQGRAKKVRVEKFKRKVRYHKVYGHRQPFTAVKVA